MMRGWESLIITLNLLLISGHKISKITQKLEKIRIYRIFKVTIKFQMREIVKAMPHICLQIAPVEIEKSNLKIDHFKIG
jgi:hypothetical protein